MIEPSSAPRRILIVRTSHFGDCVRALPLFAALRRRWPRAELGWVIEPAFRSLVERLPGLERTVPFERRGGWRAWPQVRRECRAFGAELAIDAQGNAKSAGIMALSGARMRCGWHARDWRERGFARLALTHQAEPAPAEAVHASVRIEHLIAELGLEVPEAGAVAQLFAGRRDAGDALLRDVLLRDAQLGDTRLGDTQPGDSRLGDAQLGDGPGSPAAQPLVLLQVGRAGDPRSLPPERYAELVDSLSSDGRRVLVLAGPAEIDVGRMLERRFADEPRVACLIGPMPLDDLAGLFLAAAERGARLVSADSGPLHLGAALGLACVGLHGPFDPAGTGLWPRPGSGPHRELAAGDPPDCAPCARRVCRHPQGNVCMSRIPTAAITAALDAALDAGGAP